VKGFVSIFKRFGVDWNDLKLNGIIKEKVMPAAGEERSLLGRGNEPRGPDEVGSRVARVIAESGAVVVVGSAGIAAAVAACTPGEPILTMTASRDGVLFAAKVLKAGASIGTVLGAGLLGAGLGVVAVVGASTYLVTADGDSDTPNDGAAERAAAAAYVTTLLETAVKAAAERSAADAANSPA
jgi:hypothetical protein